MTDVIEIIDEDARAYPVSGIDVRNAMAQDDRGFAFSSMFFNTLRLMLFAGFCLLISVRCLGQDFGPTADPAFQQSLRPEEPVFLPHTDRLQAVKELSLQLATEEADPHVACR